MKFTTSPRTFTRARMCLRPPFGILELSHLSRRSATGRDSSFAEKATWNKRPTQMTLGGPKKIPAFMQPPSPWMNCADILLRIRSRRSMGAYLTGPGTPRQPRRLAGRKLSHWGTPNNWQLVRDPLPAMEWRERPGGRVVRASGLATTRGFPDAPLTIPASQKVTLLLDNAELTTAFTNLVVSSGKDASIRVTYAEALKDAKGEKGNRNAVAGKEIIGVYDEYIADGAENRTFTSLVWRTWRYLQLDIQTHDQPLQLLRLSSWFTAFPFQQRARFVSDDPALSSIWEVGWRTARLDAHETYMDTPYWEQLQYVGDARIQALISYVAAGDDRLAKQAIEAFDDSRIPDGITLSRYPTHHFQAIPPFSLLWVGMLHDF